MPNPITTPSMRIMVRRNKTGIRDMVGTGGEVASSG
jgi:hypothetical protein